MNKKYCDKCKREIYIGNYVLITYPKELGTGAYPKELEICYSCLEKGIELSTAYRTKQKEEKA